MLTNDTPIATPEDDRFGIDPFAQALARAISDMPAPNGAVIAVNGPWGTGKSSAINLVLYISINSSKTGISRSSASVRGGCREPKLSLQHFLATLRQLLKKRESSRPLRPSRISPGVFCGLVRSLR